MHPQELGAAHSLHSSIVDGQWGVLGGGSLEVDNNLLRLPPLSLIAPAGQSETKTTQLRPR